MNTIDLSYTNARGQKLHAYKLGTPQKGRVLIMHGLSEHCHRYDVFASHLVDKGFEVYSLDYHGHGRSEGLPSLIEDFDHLTQDLIEFTHENGLNDCSAPTFLFAHSMGGLLALHHLIDNQKAYVAAAFSGALMMPGASIPKFMVQLSKPLGRIFPNAKWAKLHPKYVIKSQKARDIRNLDQFVNHEPPFNITGVHLLKAIDQMENDLHRINLPLLILHGEEDMIVNPKSASIIFDGVSSVDKTLHTFPKLYHEIIQEEEGETIMGEISDFFTAKL